MTRAGIAFTLASFLPVPLLALAAMYGGVWAWVALVYLTLFTFAMDEMIASVSRDGSEFPAANGLSVALALAHFGLLVLFVGAFARGVSLGDGIALFLATGLFMGQVSNSNAHELIHRNRRTLRRLGKGVYISMLFGHHSSAHPLVHHVYVASALDPNSARAGEGYYRFVLRAWIGSFRAGLGAENVRYAALPVWAHPYVGYVVGAVLCVTLAGWFGGVAGLVAYLGLAGFTQSQLLVSDYVQHYGLRRVTLPDGRLEPVGPRHSWNASHVFSSHLMLNAPRHSAHHARPALRFPELALPAPDTAPMLPRSLPAMSVLALVPPLWRRVMDPRVAYWRAQPGSQDAA